MHKPARGDIWKVDDQWSIEHHLILDDGNDHDYEIEYSTIILETGQTDMLFFRNQSILEKVA